MSALERNSWDFYGPCWNLVNGRRSRACCVVIFSEIRVSFCCLLASLVGSGCRVGLRFDGGICLCALQNTRSKSHLVGVR